MLNYTNILTLRTLIMKINDNKHDIVLNYSVNY